ncbi:MAG: long-chain-acyl-CoA synthetase [Rhodoplanes sp.]|jgi:fatty-acyl-CoA synthase
MRFFEWVRADIASLRGFSRALRAVRPLAATQTRTFPRLIDKLAVRHGERPALLSERESFTYRGLADRMNRHARWALTHGLEKGDVVCLLMPNRPEYVATWLGFTRAGGVVALVNTNLVGQSLAACIDSVAPKHVIVAAELSAQIVSAESYLKTTPRIWIKGKSPSQFPCIDSDIDHLPGGPLDGKEIRGVTLSDPALYIFTAGTTGLTKAAIIDHRRLMRAVLGFAGVLGARPTDRMFDCLPMYHMLGGVLAIGPLLARGGSVVIREKFTARDFWRDVRRTDCTILQYVGEIPSALLRAPPHPQESQHHLRLCCGAGLRPEIWREFKTRFRIPHILEFYASSEGNVTLFNFEEKEGAIGRIPWWMRRRFPTAIIRFDVEKGAPLRDSRGHCMRCLPGEHGEAIGRLKGRFAGYVDEDDNEAKILRNVFTPGDAWLRTGDLMTQDTDGYFYFIDRIGDTYRWKGENISTTEVKQALCLFPGVDDAVVYGLRVPDHEGRAGAATLFCPDWIDVSALHAHITKHLPVHARPIFLRIHRSRADAAATKLKRADLAADCLDPAQTTDQLYFNDPQVKAFVPLDAELYSRINAGEVWL